MLSIAAAILLLPLLQLVPLPPPIWTAFPGRAPVVQAYTLAGIALPWLPLSLTPDATEHFWLGLLPAVAIFLAVPRLSVDARRRLMHVAILIGVLDVVLGFSQLISGPASALRLYATASQNDAVGFFANRNHQATFLALLVVLAGPLGVGRSPTILERIWLAGAGLFLLLGIVASGSRAGLALGVGACLATAWTVMTSYRRGRTIRLVLVWGGLAGLVLLVGIVALILGPHLDLLADDLRWQIARTTWQAILRVFPVGAGFGSFERVYAQFEQPDQLIAAIINNAHDDWLEVMLEGGLPALILALAALAYLIRETVFIRIDARFPACPRAVLSATLAAFWLCALHSTVDYPLRTMAVNVVLALAAGLRVAARGDVARPDPADRSRAARISDSPARHADGRTMRTVASLRRVPRQAASRRA